MTAFEELMSFQRDTEALAQVAERLSWDQETMMPRGAAEQRGEEMAAMAAMLHGRRTDPRVGDWIAKAKAPDAAGARMVELIRRDFERNAAVPVRLAAEIARVTSVAQAIWAEARAKNDVAHFLPVLTDIVRLSREKGAALVAGGFGADAYDALLDDYEPGATAAGIAQIFDRMRPRLVALREAVLGAADQPKPLEGTFPREAQLALSRKMAEAFGYDWSRGRLDLAVHPFCSGSGNDVRITTRVSESDPLNCLYSTIHETGHAAYEQSVDQAYLLTPIGRGASMGVHESQSRICENQLGRSRAFTGWVFDEMVKVFGGAGAADADAFHAAVNRVTPGYIRTESDEVQYNLHIMMRFDLERALIAGTLAPADLEAAWNERFKADFGVAVDRPANGVLQDVHWSVGLFGYFPTYALGNVYAGCLNQAMRADLPGLDAALAMGDARAAAGWLGVKLRRFGALRSPAETVRHACGFEPSEGPLLDYLDAKFRALYRL